MRVFYVLRETVVLLHVKDLSVQPANEADIVFVIVLV